ncbi:MAG: hypothetical protein IPG71_00770 [bacterium]|nr:hypothetical protein [bacterium]
MQKQHLHCFLLIAAGSLWSGCGEPNLPELNPYLHREQVLSLPLPDSTASTVYVAGWSIEAATPHPGTPGDVAIATPAGRTLSLGWTVSGETSALPFRPETRELRGVKFACQSTPLALSINLGRDGRTLTCELTGNSQRPIEAQIEVTGSVGQVRGIAAYEERWDVKGGAAELKLPWGGSWTFTSNGTIEPSREPGRIAVRFRFDNNESRRFTLSIEPFEVSRGIDVTTSSNAANRALALLINAIPPVIDVTSINDERFEFWADMSEAQWIARAEPVKSYFKFLEVPEDQIVVLENSVAAFRTTYKWGTLPDRELTAHSVLLDEAINRLHSGTQLILLGASVETRLRDAAVWNFAEHYLAENRLKARDSYRTNGLEAVKESQKKLRELERHFKLLQKTHQTGFDSLLLESNVTGVDGYVFEERADNDLEVLRPDTVELLRICSRAKTGWFTMASKEWHAPEDLPWDLVLALARSQFIDALKFRVSPHWQIAQAALLAPEAPGLLPGNIDPESQLRAAAAELETVVETYLGIRANWAESKIVFDARLPSDWGRTKARVPFGPGELYVDYDFANNSAWIAATGLTRKFDCVVYMPTPTGAVSTQFTLEPGDAAHQCALVRDGKNSANIDIESSSLPE